ncbi:MAG: hypothetical protein PF569_01555 [Candidatus Woesearchaeota archaeon]|nr:hypothetical protein [Candidatus Woesearchaeota archaeon]
MYIHFIDSKSEINILDLVDNDKGLLYAKNVSLKSINQTIDYLIIEGFDNSIYNYLNKIITVEKFNNYSNTNIDNVKYARGYQLKLDRENIYPTSVRGSRVTIYNNEDINYKNLSLKVFDGEKLCEEIVNFCIKKKGYSHIYLQNCYIKQFDIYDVLLSDSLGNVISEEFISKDETVISRILNNSDLDCTATEDFNLKNERTDYDKIFPARIEGNQVFIYSESYNYENLIVRIFDGSKEICEAAKLICVQKGQMSEINLNNCDMKKNKEYEVRISGVGEIDVINTIISRSDSDNSKLLDNSHLICNQKEISILDKELPAIEIVQISASDGSDGDIGENEDINLVVTLKHNGFKIDLSKLKIKFENMIINDFDSIYLSNDGNPIEEGYLSQSEIGQIKFLNPKKLEMDKEYEISFLLGEGESESVRFELPDSFDHQTIYLYP